MADFDPNARIQGQYAQEARRGTGDAMQAQGDFLSQYMQDARSGANSVALQQQKAGLNQGMQAMQAQANARGSNPLAQRAAMYSGGQMMGAANNQAAMMRAQEMQNAQAMQNQYLGQNTQLRFGQEGLQQQYDFQQRQSELDAEQLRMQQQQANRQFGMDIAGTAMSGLGMGAMLSDERAKVVVPPGRPAGMTDLQPAHVGAPAAMGTLVVPDIEADPAMTAELAREGVYQLPPMEQLTARQVVEQNPLSRAEDESRMDKGIRDVQTAIKAQKAQPGGLLASSRADQPDLASRTLASGAEPVSIMSPTYDSSPGYAMGKRAAGVEGIDGRIEALDFGSMVSDVNMKQPVSSDEKDKVTASFSPRNPELVEAMASPYRAEHVDKDGRRYGIPDGYGQAPVRIDPGLREYAQPGLVPNVKLERPPPAFDMEAQARDEEAAEMARSIVPYRYDYKPGRGLPPGEQSGVMAQDLAQTDMGKNMVSRGKDGALRVDAGQAALTSLGAAGTQQREIDRLNEQVGLLAQYMQQMGGI